MGFPFKIDWLSSMFQSLLLGYGIGKFLDLGKICSFLDNAGIKMLGTPSFHAPRHNLSLPTTSFRIEALARRRTWSGTPPPCARTFRGVVVVRSSRALWLCKEAWTWRLSSPVGVYKISEIKLVLHALMC
jgi:hypothetical protein